MKTGIAAATVQCAQHPDGPADAFDARLHARLQKPAPPGERTVHFLDEAGTVPYFQCFGNGRITGRQATDLLEAHLRKTLRLAGWERDSLADVPILLGSTSWLLNEREMMLSPAHEAFISADDVNNLWHVASELQRRTDCQDVFSIATSCTASANALIQGVRLLRAGLCKRALVLGFEFFNVLSIEHFQALGLLAGQWPPSPSSGQDGLVLGESIACLALEHTAEDDSANACPSPVGKPAPEACATAGKAFIVGLAGGTDCASLTSASSRALQNVMTGALHDAGIDAAAICTLKAHGAGTAATDEAEADALRAMQLDALPRARFKPAVGHVLGASGATETALFLNTLRHGQTPAQAEAAALSADASRLPAPRPVPATGSAPASTPETSHHLLNFLGFGGSNASLVLQWRQG